MCKEVWMLDVKQYVGRMPFKDIKPSMRKDTADEVLFDTPHTIHHVGIYQGSA